MTPEHELIRDTQPLCCNWDCKDYPSWHTRCFNEDFKCVWYAIAAKIKSEKIENKRE